MGYGIKLKVWGDYAAFNRPEMKVERVSYDCITPSAARGIVEAIYWKPEMRWVIDRLHVLAPIRFTSIRRNEINCKIPISGKNGVGAVMKTGVGRLGIDVAKHRRQRASLTLRDVCYGIEAHVEILRNEAKLRKPEAKHLASYWRRASTGGFYHHPYLGVREFMAYFKPVDEFPACPDTLRGDIDLGYMLHDIVYTPDPKGKVIESNRGTRVTAHPRFFRASMHDGVIDVPSLGSGAGMILQSLNDLYDRIATDDRYGVARPNYSPQKVSFRVVIRPDGELFEIQDARVPAGTRMKLRQLLVPGFRKKSGSGLNPCFLWDNVGYMFGYTDKETKTVRARKTFYAFRDRHLRVEAEIDSSRFSAVCRFLESWDPDLVDEHPLLQKLVVGFGVFRIVGDAVDVHDDADIRRWWEAQSPDEGDAPRGQCLVTGRFGPLARLHPPIKGVEGGKPEGLIVSFNSDAYKSYGKEKSFNAPVSTVAAFRYGAALNAILDGPMRSKHRIILGDTTVAFWTDRPTQTEDIFARFVGRGVPRPDEAQDEATRRRIELFVDALRRGDEAYGALGEDPDRTNFFILGLSSNAARISVRFFHRGTVRVFLDNLRLHQQHIGMTPNSASGNRRADPEFVSNVSLLRETGRRIKGKIVDIPPILEAPLLRAVILGSRYPEAFFQAIMRRIRADRTVNYTRACAIKGCLVRNRNMEVSMSLDKERTDPAYILGRLFAALEKTQRDALGENVRATIRAKFYSSASSTPGRVFPQLMQHYQHHVSAMKSSRLRRSREIFMREIMSSLEDFPTHLDLTEQGLFAIGYYHQMQAFYTKKQEQPENDSEERKQS